MIEIHAAVVFIAILIAVIAGYAVAVGSRPRKKKIEREWIFTGRERWDEIEYFEATGYVHELKREEQLDLHTGDTRWVCYSEERTGRPYAHEYGESFRDYAEYGIHRTLDTTRLRKLDEDEPGSDEKGREVTGEQMFYIGYGIGKPGATATEMEAAYERTFPVREED